MGLHPTEHQRIRRGQRKNRLNKLLEKSIRVIRNSMSEFGKPCVLWSGGKDSMVLLHILRLIGYQLPVVCFREPWFPEKQHFANRIISEWGLEVWDYAPSGVALCQGNGRIDVMNAYQIGAQQLVLARGTEAPEEGKPFLCGKDTFLARPLGTFNFPWDLMFHGHKSSDEDPCSGKIPLETDLLNNPGSASAVYPLRDWNDEDIFAYIDLLEIPYDESRYQKIKGKWEVLPNKRLNPDYYHACFKCCDPSQNAFVTCPKNGMQLNNIADRVPWYHPQMSYCNLRTGGNAQ